MFPELPFPFSGGVNGDDFYPGDFYEEQVMLDAIAEDSAEPEDEE